MSHDEGAGDASVFDKELAEALHDLERPSGMKFSPDGSRVVYVAALANGTRKGKNRVQALWLASSAVAGSARQLTSGSYSDSSPAWHPDGNRVFFFSDRSEAGKKFGVWSMRLDGGEPMPVTPTDAEQGVRSWALSPDGRTVAYLSADEKTAEGKEEEAKPTVWGEDWKYARLRLVDVESRETRVLVEGDRHVEDVAWSPDGKQLVFYSTKTTESEECAITGSTLSTVQVESGEVKDLCSYKGTQANYTWAPDGKIYFAGIHPFGSGCGGLCVFSVDPTAAEPAPIKVASGDDDDAVELRRIGDKLLFNRVTRLGNTIGEVGGQDLFTMKESDIDSFDVHFDQSGNATLVTCLSSVNEPEEVYVRSDGKDDIKLSDHGKPLKGREFGSYKVITCKSADGEVELDALYLTPASKSDADGNPKEPLPTVVHIHGGPSDRDGTGFNGSGRYWGTYALAQGYGVLLPQYRGSLGRGEAFGRYSSLGVGKHDYNDVITLTDHAVKLGLADPARLLVGGWSQGGYLTYLSSVRNGLHGLGWRFRAGVAGAGITDWDGLCVTSRSGMRFQAELSGGSPPWLADKNDTTGRQGSALYEMAAAVREGERRGEAVIPPLLILHGATDGQCSTSQAVGFHRGMREHGLFCEFVTYPGEGHFIGPYRFRMDMLERFGRWCHTYIGPGAK